MIETGTPSGAPLLLAEHEEDLLSAAGPSLQSVEERLRRLEDAVAALQERQKQQPARPDAATAVPTADAPANNDPPTAHTALDAAQRLLPLAAGLLQAPPVASFAPLFPAAAPPAQRRPFVLFDTLDELRLIVRMLSDRRYRLGWTTILIPVCVLILMIMSSMVIGSVPVVGSVLDKALIVVLSFFIYKVLTREAQIYRQWAATYGPRG